MSDLYTLLNVSPRKKRLPSESDGSVVTPKKLRTVLPTPPGSAARQNNKSSSQTLPPHLARLCSIQTALQNALSHALATCAVSPSEDTGLVLNVLNHLSLTTYSGLTTKLELEDLKRLCWLWEWDGQPLPEKKATSIQDDNDDNPFLVAQVVPSSKDWTRGSMGLVLSPTTHLSRDIGKRVPAYGIGIEVEMDLDKDMGGGMAAVARWTAASETRSKDFRRKLERWIEMHPNMTPIPNIPQAALPQLTTATSSLTKALALSPKSSSSISIPAPPVSSTASPRKSPIKRLSAIRDFATPSPISPNKNIIPFPQTPSRRGQAEPNKLLLTPRTPRTLPFVPSTPVRQTGDSAATTPRTPSTPRREALYERIRQRSLSASPTKGNIATGSAKLTRDQMLKLGQEEMRRRCLLGRLGGVAESVWMLFSSPVGSTSTPTSRKRRAMPKAEVAMAIVKSSPVPISVAEAKESLEMLTQLCPFFLKNLEIAREEWLEMPVSNPGLEDESGPSGAPSSPGPPRGKHESAEEVMTRSPRRVKREVGGLRDVREIIRRELELTE